jgi:hypothetical protein
MANTIAHQRIILKAKNPVWVLSYRPRNINFNKKNLILFRDPVPLKQWLHGHIHVLYSIRQLSAALRVKKPTLGL